MNDATNALITTERVRLRRWQESDFPAFAAMNADAETMRYFPKPFSLEDSHKAFERMKEHHEIHGYGIWCATLHTGEFVGSIGLAHPLFESWFTPCIEIGWRVRKELWNQGLATEAAAAVLDYAAHTLHAGEIYSFTSFLNLPSIRVMQKIGMEEVGQFDHPRVEEGHALRAHVVYKKMLD